MVLRVSFYDILILGDFIMRKNIKGVNINYEFYDNESKINLVYLHGWG